MVILCVSAAYVMYSHWKLMVKMISCQKPLVYLIKERVSDGNTHEQITSLFGEILRTIQMSLIYFRMSPLYGAHIITKAQPYLLYCL